MPALFITLIAAILTWVDPTVLILNPLWYVIILMIGSIILDFGVLLIAVGAMKLGKIYKDALSKGAGILGLIAAMIGLVATILVLVGAFVPALTGIAGILNLVTFIMFGVFFLLLGIAFVILRAKTGKTGLAMATGIMTIIAGSMFCSFVLSFIGIIILIPVAILAAMLFLKAKGGAPEVGEVKKLVVRPAVVKVKKRMKPEEIEAEVHKYVKEHPEGIDLAECAKGLGVSEDEVETAVNALVKKGKLETG